MTNKYAWTRHSDDTIWHGGVCDSVKECVEEARSEGYEDTDTFAVGYVEPYEVNYINGDLILDDLQEQAFDAVGEVAEDWLAYITKEQTEDLNNRLLKVVREWIKDCNEEPTFYKVLPFDELTLSEAEKKYNHPTEKVGTE